MIILSLFILTQFLSCFQSNSEKPSIIIEKTEVSHAADMIAKDLFIENETHKQKVIVNAEERTRKQNKSQHNQHLTISEAKHPSNIELTIRTKAPVVQDSDLDVSESPLEIEEKGSNSDIKINNEAAVLDKKTVSMQLNHATWQLLLSKYVSSTGIVDYQGFKKEESLLDSYIKHLSENAGLKDASRAQKMAFWINAYNAHTVKLILKNYPLKSIRDIYSGNPWDVKWIILGDKTYSLNQIEHDILRPQFKDARIHFAVNCAAKSCPKLANSAFTDSNLETQLDQLTRSFINDSAQNKINAKSLALSSIFDWYAADFGNIVEFINKYASTKVDAKSKLSYLEYNWALNGK